MCSLVVQAVQKISSFENDTPEAVSLYIMRSHGYIMTKKKVVLNNHIYL